VRVAVLVAMCGYFLAAAPALATFGLDSVSATAINRDGSVDLRAGSRPYEYKLSFSMNHNSAGNVEGTLRDLIVELPPGLIGNPQAVPRCSGADFEGLFPSCPGNTQIGLVEMKAEGLPVVFSSVYNLTPPLGVAARIGTSLFAINSLQEASLRTGDYGLSISDVTLPTDIRIQSVTETIWGTPPDPTHDAQRECRGPERELVVGCASDIEPAPFLTLPTSCTGPLATTVAVDSLEEPDVFHAETVDSLDDGGNPAGLDGCEQPPFSPTLTARPETTVSDSPTGLHISIHTPQNDDPAQLASANLKDAVLTLPRGMALNPSMADGLQACLPAEIDLQGPAPARCPDAAKIGTVQIDIPLLDHPVSGAVYLAKQEDNPFEALLAFYIAVDDPISGVIVKLAGKIEPDPVTGQLTASFPNSPQLPFEDLQIDLRGGARAALTTPSTCGDFTTTSDLTPWTTPEGSDAFPSGRFQIDAAANGGACVFDEAQESNAPSFAAGTTNPLAGDYSPLVLKLSRENGSQRLAALDVTLPPGLTGKLAGVQRCPDAQIAVAVARGNPGEGAVESSSPSCPEASEVGSVIIGAGSGSLLYVPGHAYLAGPYKGAPFSLAITAPVVVGPLDLGTVVVRSALYVNPDTAQVTLESDPIPAILQGIPLDMRSVEITIGRPEFTLNPTSCEAMSVNGRAVSTLSQASSLSERFQVAGCRGLAFRPSFSASSRGNGGFNQSTGASLTVKIASKQGPSSDPASAGEANLAKLDVSLPLALSSRLTTLQRACTERQFATNPAGCPAASSVGTAVAHTPILKVPLSGPAYLVSHGGATFPDLDILLQGEGVTIDLLGSTQIKRGITYLRFDHVPDAPISSFELNLPEGPFSALAATRSLCARTKTVTVSRRVTKRVHGHAKHEIVKVKKFVPAPLTMPTTITGQNGAVLHRSTKVAVTGCRETKPKKISKGKRKGKKASFGGHGA
jgi:hypothetical protein